MGRLIVFAQMTMDSVMDQLENWFDSEGESEVDGLEELRAASVVILGRETYEVLSTSWSSSESMYAGLINRSRKYVAYGRSRGRWPGTRGSSAVTRRRPRRR